MSVGRGLFASIDFGLVTPVIILVVLSLTTLASVEMAFFKNQLFFLTISVCAFLFFSQIQPKVIQMYAYPIYIISIASLLFVFILGIETRGAIRWLDIFGLRIQLSEILKPFLALSLSTFLAYRPLSFKTFLLTFCFLLPLVFLLYLQPDLGNALVYLFATLFTLVVFGFPLIWFILAIASLFLTAPLFWNLMHEYQKQRILSFLYPTTDPLGLSYNAIQSVIAVGSGAIFGKGLAESTQSGLQFLPERHTDFIFATISEGLGLVGSILILASFGFLLFRIFLIFSNSNDNFTRLFATISFSFIFIQFFINIGMNVGLVPIIGITLPFVSYGGSSLLSSFILLGLLSSVTHLSKEKNILEIR